MFKLQDYHYKRLEQFLAKKTVEFIEQEIDGSKLAIKETVDTGYDCSTYGRTTQQDYAVGDGVPLSEIYEQPTGNSIATHCSGSGMMCETWGHQIGDRVFGDWFGEWYDAEKLPREDGDVPDSVFDELHKVMHQFEYMISTEDLNVGDLRKLASGGTA